MPTEKQSHHPPQYGNPYPSRRPAFWAHFGGSSGFTKETSFIKPNNSSQRESYNSYRLRDSAFPSYRFCRVGRFYHPLGQTTREGFRPGNISPTPFLSDTARSVLGTGPANVFAANFSLNVPCRVQRMVGSCKQVVAGRRPVYRHRSR